MGMSSRPGAINVQTANFTRCNVKKRRRISKRRRLDKLTQSSCNYVTLRASGVNGYANAAGGYFVIANANNTTADLGHYLPMWYFDITATQNSQAVPGTNNNANLLVAGQCVYRPFIRTSPTPQLTFNKNVAAFKDPSGTVGAGGFGYYIVQGSVPNNVNVALQNNGLRAALHNWFSAKMLCYGLLNTPVRFRISLVRFHKEHLVPGWWDTNFGNVTGSSGTEWNMQEAVNLQQYLAGPFRYSPLNEQNQNMRKLYTEKVIKDFVLAAPTSGTPYMHQLNIFEQFNTIRRYDWEQGVYDPTDPAYNNETFTINTARLQPNVNFTKRWYLLVRAQAIDGTTVDPAAPAPDTTKWPSFDILLKNKYTMIE